MEDDPIDNLGQYRLLVHLLHEQIYWTRSRLIQQKSLYRFGCLTGYLENLKRFRETDFIPTLED